jgi:hypothetical protein
VTFHLKGLSEEDFLDACNQLAPAIAQVLAHPAPSEFLRPSDPQRDDVALTTWRVVGGSPPPF